MTLLDSFTTLLNDFNENLKNWATNKQQYERNISHLLLSPVIEEADRFFKDGLKASKQLVFLGKLHEALVHNGLPTGKHPYSILLYASILKNPLQYQQAFARLRETAPYQLEDLIWTIKNAKAQTDQILKYADTLASVVWKDGSETPTDGQPKWVFLTEGSAPITFTYLEKEAYYDLKENCWVFNGEPADETFEVLNWTDVRAFALKPTDK